MTNETESLTGHSTVRDWRSQPGFAIPGRSTLQSVNSLFAHFLNGRTSPSVLPDTHIQRVDWGNNRPFERVLRGRDDLYFAADHPQLLENLVTIIEPWRHVGVNELGEEVHASRNVAYAVHKAADADSVLLPAWAVGTIDPQLVARVATRGMAVVMEGGAPSVFDPASFEGSAAPRADLFALVEELLLSRSSKGAPCVFICLGHQLACECLIRLIRRAVDAVLDITTFPLDYRAKAVTTLHSACSHIEKVGRSLRIVQGGKEIASGWRDPQFVNTPNWTGEVGGRKLRPYCSPHPSETTAPPEVIDAHDVLAEQSDGIINRMLQYESNIKIDMFHNNVVDQEAILFANWALMRLHSAVLPHRQVLAASSLSWLLQLPFAVEIQASTCDEDGRVVTACSSTCIYYRDLESQRMRRSWTCQFHPELRPDLRDYGQRDAPDYAELKDCDGARLLVRLLHAGISD